MVPLKGGTSHAVTEGDWVATQRSEFPLFFSFPT